jgi:hypothetical protein
MAFISRFHTHYSSVENKNLIQIYLILSRVGVTLRRDLEWIFGFISLMHSTHNYKQYRATANLRTLQFTAVNTSVLNLLQSPLFSGNGFHHSNYTSLNVTAACMKSSSHSLINSFLAISPQSSSTAVSRDSLNFLLSWPEILVV